MKICRNCLHAHIPESDNSREQEGIAAMVNGQFRQCKAARTPPEKARWVTGGCECLYPERFKRKGESNER